ncbi:hypothetical protein ACQPTN_32440 [Bradyrhizobium sp. 13971]
MALPPFQDLRRLAALAAPVIFSINSSRPIHRCISLSGAVAGASVIGSAGDDILAGAGLAQTLSGGDGNDIIFANQGSDTVFGGTRRRLHFRWDRRWQQRCLLRRYRSRRQCRW